MNADELEATGIQPRGDRQFAVDQIEDHRQIEGEADGNWEYYVKWSRSRERKHMIQRYVKRKGLLFLSNFEQARES